MTADRIRDRLDIGVAAFPIAQFDPGQPPDDPRNLVCGKSRAVTDRDRNQSVAVPLRTQRVLDLAPHVLTFGELHDPPRAGPGPRPIHAVERLPPRKRRRRGGLSSRRQPPARWRRMASTPGMVREMSRSSRGGACDDSLAITIPFSGSANTFWPNTPTPKAIGASPRCTYHLLR